MTKFKIFSFDVIFFLFAVQQKYKQAGFYVNSELLKPELVLPSHKLVSGLTMTSRHTLVFVTEENRWSIMHVSSPLLHNRSTEGDEDAANTKQHGTLV